MRVLFVALLGLSTVLALTLAGCFRSRRAADSTPTDSVTTESLPFGGMERTYLVHLPPGYKKGTPAPLVMAFHGGTSNAKNTVKGSGLNATSDAHGFIAVYPNGTGALGDRILTWNVLWGYGYALRNDVDDVGFVRAMVEDLKKKYSVDPARVYATGLSNGAMLSYRLGSELSDVIAAIAPVEGAIGASSSPGSPLMTFSQPDQPVSVMIFHGKADRFVPYEGGEGKGLTNAVYLPVSYALDSWVAWDGCGPTPSKVTSSDGNVTVDTYSGGKSGTEVALVTIDDGRHTWPQGSDYPVVGGKEVSGNELMWQFFEAHARR